MRRAAISRLALRIRIRAAAMIFPTISRMKSVDLFSIPPQDSDHRSICQSLIGRSILFPRKECGPQIAAGLNQVSAKLNYLGYSRNFS